MQMNLHFAKAVRFQFSQLFEQWAVILLARIEIGVAERRSIAVTRSAANGASLLTPFIHTRSLRRQINHAVSFIPRRLEVVRHNQDKMRATITGARPQPPQCLARHLAGAPQGITAQPWERPFEFI